jgi:CheY-like chemotaxis protein
MFRILAVDDNALQLDLRKAALEAAGYEALGALTLPQTTREMQRGRVDLIVMDLRLPNTEGTADAHEGMQLIRCIRELDTKVPIIVLSGWPEELYGQPEEQMVSRVLVKPVKANVLMDAVRELLP